MLRGSSPRERLLHRLHSVALVLHGLSAAEAAKVYDDSPRAVAYWVERFQDKDVAGLEEEARSGRPSKLAVSEMKKVQTFIQRSHTISKPLNAQTLSEHIRKNFGIKLTPRQCWRILRRFRE